MVKKIDQELTKNKKKADFRFLLISLDKGNKSFVG